MISIADILRVSLAKNSTSPLFIHRDENDTSWTVSYSDASEIIIQYRHLIQKNIDDCVLSAIHVGESPHIIDTERIDTVLTIAFLAMNSSNLLLSVIASVELSHERKVSIVLLNTRWTSSEIARSLHISEPRVQSDKPVTTMSITLLIYAPETELIAKEAALIIDSTATESNRNFTFPIPLSCVSKIAASSDFPSQKTNIPTQIDEISLDQVSRNDAVILFTSGTSSSEGSKGVRLSHLSLFVQATAKRSYPCHYDNYTRLYASALPFFHVGGLSSAISIILAGGSLVLLSSNDATLSFNPSSMYHAISHKHNPVNRNANTLAVVPAMLHSLFEHMPENQQLVELKLILVGGQSLSQDLLQRCSWVFPNARIVQTYACTEAGSSITFADVTKMLKSSENKLGGCYVGIAPWNIDVQIYDREKAAATLPSLVPLAPYCTGMIGTRGPHVMNGYWRKPNDAILEDTGWLITNDLGYLTEHGALYFCGRSDDIIRTGGESVLATEIESILMQHTMIDSVAIFPLPDERLGQTVCAAITLKEGNNFQPSSLSRDGMYESAQAMEEIRRFCAARNLSGYKHPRIVFVCRDLPRNSGGKVLKFQLIILGSRLKQRSSRNSKL